MKLNAIFADFDAAVRAMRSGDYKPSVKIGRDEEPEAKDGPFLGVGSKYASQDLISSVHWLEMAADGGLPEAQQLLGVMLSRGDVMWPDPVASCAYHRLAAVQGLAEAQGSYGRSLCSDYSARGDVVEGLKWLRAGAGQNNAPSQFELGMMHLRGRGLPQNQKEAIAWIMQASDQGFAPAQHRLVQMYEENAIRSTSNSDVIKLLRMSADQGYSYAQYDLGMQCRGRCGVAEDVQEAFNWFLRAAENGNFDGRRAVAVAYLVGEGVEVNHERAMEWLIKVMRIPGEEFSTDLFEALSVTNWRETFEAATARWEADDEEDEKVGKKIRAARARKKARRKLTAS